MVLSGLSITFLTVSTQIDESNHVGIWTNIGFIDVSDVCRAGQDSQTNDVVPDSSTEKLDAFTIFYRKVCDLIRDNQYCANFSFFKNSNARLVNASRFSYIPTEKNLHRLRMAQRIKLCLYIQM